MLLKKWLVLPPSVLVTVFAFVSVATANPITPAPSRPTGTGIGQRTRNGTNLPSTGSGLSYAKACWEEQMSFDSASSSWVKAHETISTTYQIEDGTSISDVTYYENATTLCDGHPRVTYSPAISLSTGQKTYANSGANNWTSTIVQTFWYGDYTSEQPSPSCSITATSDCDALYSMYTSSVAAGTPPYETPQCLNATEAAQYSSATEYIYGCGDCTIYGDGVELVYFPTTKERDFCASTPTATLTHYGPSAVITAYAGKSTTTEGQVFDNRTVWADGHAFTTETAYISISTVYAVDRCSKTRGTPIKDAILAMPSESVLSLRYSQDHFQQVMKTDIQTGYPVDYADFNTPIPWSAWNGQNICDPGGYGGYMCSIIYEHSFRPQLAIPPQITDLSPDFKTCQMWYNGLWDPPLALHPANSVVKPTAPGGGGAVPATTTAEAVPSNKPQPPTAPATAHATAQSIVVPAPPPAESSAAQQTPGLPAATAKPKAKPTGYVPASEPWQKNIKLGGKNYAVSAANGQCHIAGVTLTAGGPAKTLPNGVTCSYGQDGLVVQGSDIVNFDDTGNQAEGGGSQPQGSSGNSGNGDNGGAQNNNPTHTDPIASYISGGLVPTEPGQNIPNQNDDDKNAAVITVGGHTVTAVQTQGGHVVMIGSSITLTPGGSATTISGEVISAATDGVVVDYTSTVGNEEPAGTEAAQSGEPSETGASNNYEESNSSSSNGASNEATATATGGASLATGSASSMSPAQAFSLFTTLLAVVVIGG